MRCVSPMVPAVENACFSGRRPPEKGPPALCQRRDVLFRQAPRSPGAPPGQRSVPEWRFPVRPYYGGTTNSVVEVLLALLPAPPTMATPLIAGWAELTRLLSPGAAHSSHFSSSHPHHNTDARPRRLAGSTITANRFYHASCLSHPMFRPCPARAPSATMPHPLHR